MLARPREKIERRLGEKLFLKGERCLSPKCAMVRKPYPPGFHGKKRRRGGSEYSELLKEKQKIRFLYGLDNNDLKRYFVEAKKRKGNFEDNLSGILESRLDNVVFRLGLTLSRSIARQLVSHGHIMVDGRAINIPSYRVRKGEVVEIKPSKQTLTVFADLPVRFKKFEAPQWLSLDKEKKSGKMERLPSRVDLDAVFNLSLISEFYSR